MLPAHETPPVDEEASSKIPKPARLRRVTTSRSDTTLNVQRAGPDDFTGGRKRQASTSGGAGWKVGVLAMRHRC